MAMQESESQSNESEISLLDIINFANESWKKLAVASLVGMILGVAGWHFLGNYQAELVLINNGGIDLIGLRSLQKSLPNLASEIIDQSKAPQDQESFYRTLSEPGWWKKNLIPTYAITKADTKELGSIAGLESAGTSILSLTIMAEGSSKNEALNHVRGAKNFLLEGASYLTIKSLLNSQVAQLLSDDAGITKKINATQVELGYLQERLKSLESLAKRFPNESKITSQVVDPKDSGAKYMPISTQIIAANTDINVSKESLERLKNAQAQMLVMHAWIKQVEPLVESSYDGLALIRQLLQEEAQMRATLGSGDPKSLAFLDSLRSSLIDINVRFTKGMEMNTVPVATKKGMLKTTAGGLAGTFFLMLMILLGQRVLINIKSSGAK